jgi:hypothetical protein
VSHFTGGIMPIKKRFSAGNIALYLITALLFCTLIFAFSCSSPQAKTPLQSQDIEPPSTTQTPGISDTSSSSPGLSSWIADAKITENEYSHTASYDNGNYEISWASDDEYIYVFIRARTQGFVSLGIQPDTTMKQADIIFGTVENGKAVVLDEFSTNAFGPHKPDIDFEGGVSNITEYAGSESEGFTIIEFRRKLDTGDDFDHPVVTGINKIIWAYGSSDDPNVKHISRGYGELEL